MNAVLLLQSQSPSPSPSPSHSTSGLMSGPVRGTEKSKIGKKYRTYLFYIYEQIIR